MSAHEPFLVHRPEFRDVLGPEPRSERFFVTDAHEGPVYVPAENALYFTTLPAPTNTPLPGFQVAIKRLALPGKQLDVVRADSNMGNGMTLDREGRLVVCEQGTRTTHARLSRLDPRGGEPETIVDAWFGLRFNSPNDVVVKSDGTIWFTDPSYGALQKFKDAPQIGDYVYRHDPATGDTSVVADSFNKPNGLAFSPDERILYINDSAAVQGPGTYRVDLPHHLRAFDVADGCHLVGGRLFAVVSPGIPDGLKVDTEGRVYSSSATGVKVYDPVGRLLGEIVAPGVANFCFGGPEGNELFMMADTVIYRAVLRARGAGLP